MRVCHGFALGDMSIYGATGTDANAHSIHLQYIGQFLGGLPPAQVPEPSVGLIVAGMLICTLRRRI